MSDVRINRDQAQHGPGQWLSAQQKALVGLVLTILLALAHPFAGLAAAVFGVFVLRGRSRLVMAAMALLLIGYVLFFTTTFAASTGVTKGSP